MKKIEAFIQQDMLDPVIKAIREIGVGGLTVLNAQGQGAAEPPLVGQFFSKNIVVVVVEVVDEVVEVVVEEEREIVVAAFAMFFS